MLVRAVGGGRRRRRETVAGDGAAGDRLVHLLLLLGREVGGRHQVAQFTAVPAAAAAVTVLVVHLLVLHRLEYLNVVNTKEKLDKIYKRIRIRIFLSSLMVRYCINRHYMTGPCQIWEVH